MNPNFRLLCFEFEFNQRTRSMKTNRVMALKLSRSNSYPKRETFIAFGKVHCLVRHPQKMIDYIARALSECGAKLGTPRCTVLFVYRRNGVTA
jgi:hypothetical protein